MSNSSKRVVVAMSGGVDSSVAACLLKKDGFDVLGIFMKNWHDTNVTISKECPWLEDSNDAMLVAEKLSIPFQVIDLSKEYKNKIVDYMFEEYKNGRTPNPDVLCNREIKFDIFLDIAMNLGADYIATGHYAQIKQSKKNNQTLFRLLAGRDKSKDQSYFLCQLNQSQLSKTMFPIGQYEKKKVRQIAEENDLITANKKDSQGLCFIGKVKLPDFLQQRLKPKKGQVILIDQNHDCFKSANKLNDVSYNSKEINYKKMDGQIIGDHNGAHFFTVGQRKGLSIGGRKKPIYVLGTDVVNNIVYVGEGSKHPGLFRFALRVRSSEMHFVSDVYKKLKINNFKARIRYRQALQDVSLIKKSKNYFFIFKKPQKAITRGQFIAVYNNDELICSGIID